MKLLRALAAIATLLVVVVGVPFLLLSWGHVDALVGVDWGQVLTAPDDGQVLLGLLSLAGWAAWLIVALTTLFEVFSAITRGRVAIRLPGTGWLRPTITALVAAATFAPTTALAAPPVPAPPPSTATETTVTTRPRTLSPEAPAPLIPHTRAYVVQPGDELWDIAERELGSGDRWRDIVAVTAGLTAESRLTPGQRLVLPESAEQSAPEKAAANEKKDEKQDAPRTVVVARGDSLWRLAEEHLGDGERWPEIYRLNKDQIADPDLIDIGWVLTLPTEKATGEDKARPVQLIEDAQSVIDVVEPEPLVPFEPHAELMAESHARVRVTPVAPPDPRPPQQATSDIAPAHLSVDGEAPDVGVLLGSMAAVLAASVAGGLSQRRRLQVLGRSVGHRIAPLGSGLLRFWTALVRRAGSTSTTQRDAAPTAWLAGWDAEGNDVLHHLEEAGRSFVTGPQDSAQGLLGSAITSLLCAPWSEEVSLVVADAPDDWAASLDDPAIQAMPTDEALRHLAAITAERRIGLGLRSLGEVRADAELAAAWAPVVFVFAHPLRSAQRAEVERALKVGEVGVSVLAASADVTESSAIQVSDDSLLLPTHRDPLTPHLIGAPARRALVQLFSDTASPHSTPAPWWTEDPEAAGPPLAEMPQIHTAEVTPMPEPPSPTLLLLGEVDLLHPAGPAPSKARMQCIEYCAWLLTHPGATSIHMQRGLMVAESTRRSNMSRLRTWLGTAPDGRQYLPDAYSGRIELHPKVSSDWERFDALISGSVNLSSTPALTEALGLVRGEPLQGVAFQWAWAEDIRVTMEATIVDAACALFDRLLPQGDTATAEWALGQGRLAAPHDENLASRAVQYWAALGDRQRADEEVLALTRTARATGRDLQQETVTRIQHALRPVVTEPRRGVLQ